MPHLTCSIDDGIATLVLSHPPQNRVHAQMATELALALETTCRSRARAVLVRAGSPDFSFGGGIVDRGRTRTSPNRRPPQTPPRPRPGSRASPDAEAPAPNTGAR
ncbi:hypothetical protein ACIQMR_36315 [Streptomyces sp. NPDC091376]|uniref:hypothetical protein n=1 Tax=Streptomyces sp. NPDC091376 TaxID=3365994 RepID=UPI0038229FB7